MVGGWVGGWVCCGEKKQGVKLIELMSGLSNNNSMTNEMCSVSLFRNSISEDFFFSMNNHETN